MTVTAPTDVALYLLNSKRDLLSAIEDDAGYTIAIKSSGAMIPGDFEIDSEKASSGRRRRKKFNRAEFLEGDADDHLLPDSEEDEDEDENELEAAKSEEDGEEGSGRRKRRRRGRRGGRRRRKDGEAMDPGAPPSDGGGVRTRARPRQGHGRASGSGLQRLPPRRPPAAGRSSAFS